MEFQHHLLSFFVSATRFVNFNCIVACAVPLSFLSALPNPVFAQKGKRPTPKAPPKVYTYKWQVDGKTIKIICDKPLPTASIGRTYQDAALVPQLRKNLSDMYNSAVRFESLYRSTSLELATIRNSVDEKDEENRELRDKISEIGRQFRMVDLQYSFLKRQFSDFSYYDWKLIVPEVDRKTRRLGDELESLKKTIDD